MPGDIIIKALGLNTSPNALNVPPGSLIEAMNVIIRRDQVIESRRGYKLYGTALPSSNDRTKQLLVYQGRILRHYSNILQFDTGEVNLDNQAIFDNFNREFVKTGDTQIASSIIQNINTSQISIGLTVTGTGIPASTTVTFVDDTSITINNPATASNNNITLTFTGTELVTNVEEGHRIRSVESNENFYFTTGEGIRKLSANSASDLSSTANFVTNAGGIKATGAQARLTVDLGNLTGFLPQDSAVAYRAVWANEDRNKQVIQGTPSERTVIYNPLINLLNQDFMRILLAVDNVAQNPGGATIGTYGYLNANKVEYNSSALTLYNNILSFTQQLDADIYPTLPAITNMVWSGGYVTITFAADPTILSAGEYITLSGVEPLGYNGTYQLQTVDHATFQVTYELANDPSAYVSGTGTAVKSRYFAIEQPSEPDVPTPNSQLVAIQDYLNLILSELQSEDPANITAPNLAAFITPIVLTTTAEAQITIDIPDGVTSSHYMQLYRSDIVEAVGEAILSDLAPNDEMKQVYEAFPTSAEITSGFMVVNDNTPDQFRGANLYTNPASGEGILQANDVPPVALDVARFKNVIFYANTKTRQRLLLNMLGVSNFKAGEISSSSVANPTVITTTAAHSLSTGDIVYLNDTGTTPPLSGLYPVTVTGTTTFTVPVAVTVGSTSQGYWTNSMISIVSENSSTLYKFVRGVVEITEVDTVADVANSLNGTYFLLNSANDITSYYVWYKTSGGVETDPSLSGKIGIRVDIVTGDSANTVAIKTRDSIAAIVSDFTTSASANTVTITNVNEGYADAATSGTSGFTITVTQVGRGENVSNQEVLLSNANSPSIALDLTSRSFVKVVNLNEDETVNAFYLSGVNDVPGKMLIEGRYLSNNNFYVMASSSAMGNSFSPILTPSSLVTITNSLASPTIITTPTPHGLVSGDLVTISFSNSNPSISGVHVVTFLTNTTFSIPVSVTTAGTTGLYEAVSRAIVSDNEQKINRVYYSKFSQPEAVPIVNYLDVGSGDKEILRIFALRDSLFVFKEDGLFRISGEIAPFTQMLFDESCILKAWDSLDQGNNNLYGWTLQGIQLISEAGVELISRPIDETILKLASANYPNFTSLTWGIGYNSDNSYTVYTNSETTDTNATIGFRYSFLTNTWTTVDKTTTCGVINNSDDKMYLGAGDVNYIEQERKTFSRLDYADREDIVELLSGNYFNNIIKLPSVTNIKVGDVLVQTQLVSIYAYNSFLNKLDLDPGVGNINITSISTGANPLVTTVVGPKALGHNLQVGDYVILSNTNSFPQVDGVYEVLTVPSSTTFTFAADNPVTIAGTSGKAKLSYGMSMPIEGGATLRTELENLADRLDTDPGTASTDYADIIDSKSGTITIISAENPTKLTSVAHELLDQRVVVITGTNSTPQINSTYVASVLNVNQFTVPKSVVISGSTGSFTTDINDPRDVLACFNGIIEHLNVDTGAAFTNYTPITTVTTLEAAITNVDIFTEKITLNVDLPLLTGDMTVFHSIQTSYTYAPITMGDVLGFKHLHNFTMMFENKAFTSATVLFASDLQPMFIEQPFPGDGPGLFGYGQFGSGYFGGGSNSAPFRTLIPRNCQRCRYLLVQFKHQVAREKFSIYGITVDGQVGLSNRAYR